MAKKATSKRLTVRRAVNLKRFDTEEFVEMLCDAFELERTNTGFTVEIDRKHLDKLAGEFAAQAIGLFMWDQTTELRVRDEGICIFSDQFSGDVEHGELLWSTRSTT